MSNSNMSQRNRTLDAVNHGLAKRRRAEKRFRRYGVAAVLFGLSCVLILFVDIVSKGHSAFLQARVQLPVVIDAERLGASELEQGNYQLLLKDALQREFPDVSGRRQKRELNNLLSSGAGYQLRQLVLQQPDLVGSTINLWVALDDDADVYVKNRNSAGPEQINRLSERQKHWLDQLVEADKLQLKFNDSFFSAGDSREPEQAGIRGALMGSLYTLLVTFALSFPIGVAAAIYLEEYATPSRLTDIIEININNLAAVPSIIFGLLGLAIFINLFEMPRSIPLVGGFVLTLMTLPTIIISSRAAIKAVPPSVREAALALGASKMQVILHHVLPLALPGMLTGAIIGMAQALGETAPLLMIGMVAFIVDVPAGISDPSTVLPVQIFLWSDSPERSFVALTSAAIMVLLGFLILMNTIAVLLRRRLEKRW